MEAHPGIDRYDDEAFFIRVLIKTRPVSAE